MARLIHKKTQTVLVDSVIKAENILNRIKGLMGTQDMPLKEALWISPCANIHTFFMKFPIDVIFVDRKLKITSLSHSVPSSRFVFGGWKSHSVFEMKANQIRNYQIKKGDELYVDY